MILTLLIACSLLFYFIRNAPSHFDSSIQVDSSTNDWLFGTFESIETSRTWSRTTQKQDRRMLWAFLISYAFIFIQLFIHPFIYFLTQSRISLSGFDTAISLIAKERIDVFFTLEKLQLSRKLCSFNVGRFTVI